MFGLPEKYGHDESMGPKTKNRCPSNSQQQLGQHNMSRTIRTISQHTWFLFSSSFPTVVSSLHKHSNDSSSCSVRRCLIHRCIILVVSIPNLNNSPINLLTWQKKICCYLINHGVSQYKAVNNLEKMENIQKIWWNWRHYFHEMSKHYRGLNNIWVNKT